MRIAIVNDLPLARAVLRRLVLSVPGYSVAWEAEDGAQAVRAAASDRPDVILMDLVMPVLDGAEATRQIMARHPCPILLVTASVRGNFPLVLRALASGGLDAVATPVLAPDGKIAGADRLLVRLERLALQLRGQGDTTPRATRSWPAPPAPSGSTPLPPLLALGASTGGPDALARILAGLPRDFPAAVVIVQHIAAEFALGLVDFLQANTPLPVELALPGAEPRPGAVCVAATDDHLVLRGGRTFAITSEPSDYPYRPSIDVFFESLAVSGARPGVAALLTGMQDDGARGLLALRQAGWLTLAQDQATSVVYGMPRAAADLHAACRILPLPQMAPAIVARLGRTMAAP
jgi:two-component system response regulator WspF